MTTAALTPAGSVREQVASRTKRGVALGEIGGATSIVAQNTWLLYFLVNIAGLQPIAAGTVFLVGRVADAFFDPIVGDYVDRNVHRMPRLNWVRLASLPFGISFALMWALPLIPGPVFVYALFGLILHSALFTVATMPLVSLTPVLATSYDARTTLTGWRVASGILFTLVAISGPPAIVLATTGDSDLASSAGRGWVVMGALFGLLALVGYTYAGRAIREPKVTVASGLGRLDREVLRGFWRVREFRTLIVLSMVLTVAVMVGNATLPFFLESVLGMGAGQQSATLGAFFLLSILAIPVWSAIASRIGKPRTLAYGTGVYIVGVLLFAGLKPTTETMPALVLVIVVAGIGLSAVTVLPLAMLPDCAEYLEEATGERREGLLFALFAFATKVAGSVGVFGSAIIASLVGYESGTSEQDAGTQLGLTVVIGPVAATLFAVGLVLALRSPLTRPSFEAVRKRVLDRRAALLADEQPSAAGSTAASVKAPAVRLVERVDRPAESGRLAPLAARIGLTEGQLQTAAAGLTVAAALALVGLPPVLRNDGRSVVATLPGAASGVLPGKQQVLAPAAPPDVSPPVVVAEPPPVGPDVFAPGTPVTVLPPPAVDPFLEPAPGPSGSTPTPTASSAPPPAAPIPLTIAESAWFGEGPAADVPATGLPVAERLGMQRVSVVRLDGTASTLVLGLADAPSGQQGEGLATIRVCRVTEAGWKSAPAQPAADEPASDCTDAVSGVRGADGRWSFDLSRFAQRAGGAGFVLRPGVAGGPPFQVVFTA